jgi:hypothetical protein
MLFEPLQKKVLKKNFYFLSVSVSPDAKRRDRKKQAV